MILRPPAVPGPLDGFQASARRVGWKLDFRSQAGGSPSGPHHSRLVIIDINVVVAAVAFVTAVVVDGALPQDPRQVFPGTVDGINFAS